MKNYPSTAAIIVAGVLFSFSLVGSAHAQTPSPDNEKVTMCHATGSSSNPYVTITVSKNGANGHEGHSGDINPAPAAGCPSVNATANASNQNDKVTICHATGSASNPYVVITISKNGLNGHGGHVNDINPAPAAGCPGVLTPSTTTALVVSQLNNAGFTTVDTNNSIVELGGVWFVVLPGNNVVGVIQYLQALPSDTAVYRYNNSFVIPQPGTPATAVTQSLIAQTLGTPTPSAQIVAALTQAPAPAATGSGGNLDESSAAGMLSVLTLLMVAGGLLARTVWMPRR